MQDLSTKSCGFHAVLHFISMSRYTGSGFLSIYGDNPRLNDLLVENTLSYLCNINFSALRVKYFQNVCNLSINKTCTHKTLCTLDFFFDVSHRKRLMSEARQDSTFIHLGMQSQGHIFYNINATLFLLELLVK